MLNGGFDWWYESNPHAALAIDTSEFHSGTRSLSVTFDGQNARRSRNLSVHPSKTKHRLRV